MQNDRCTQQQQQAVHQHSDEAPPKNESQKSEIPASDRGWAPIGPASDSELLVVVPVTGTHNPPPENHGVLRDANLQRERIPPPMPSSESLTILFKSLTYARGQENQRGQGPNLQYSVGQKTPLKLRRRQLPTPRATKSNIVQKVSSSASRQAVRAQIISRRGTMNSIIRGVSHIQTCGGCDRLICGSTYRLVRQCAQHVRTCPLLSCSQCVSCKIARMVQVAWRVARDGHHEMSSKSKCVKYVTNK
jgi:hypothetical protein